MLFHIYGPMFLIIAVAASLASLFFVGATLLGRHKKPSADKNAPFECGSESTGGRDVKLSVKFYLTAILFVVFDIEAVFVYPWAVRFRDLGWFGLVEMLGFLSVIVVALIYVWRKGSPRMGDLRKPVADPRGQRARVCDDAGRRAARLGPQVFALHVPLRDRVLRHGVHGADEPEV